MYIPLIQETLCYGYFLETDNRNKEHVVEGVVFVASVVSYIHAASASAASIVSHNMWYCEY